MLRSGSLLKLGFLPRRYSSSVCTFSVNTISRTNRGDWALHLTGVATRCGGASLGTRTVGSATSGSLTVDLRQHAQEAAKRTALPTCQCRAACETYQAVRLDSALKSPPTATAPDGGQRGESGFPLVSSYPASASRGHSPK